jgi:lipoate-protein ligase B
MPDRLCQLIQLPGLTDYGEALELQRELAQARIRGDVADDALILLEHPAIITLGRGAREANVTAPRALLNERGVSVVHVERGGDVTYHGPGQLVGYPILDLTRHRQDLHWYLRRLEDVLIGSLAHFGISLGGRP